MGWETFDILKVKWLECSDFEEIETILSENMIYHQDEMIIRILEYFNNKD